MSLRLQTACSCLPPRRYYMYRPYSSSLADSRSFMDVQSLIRNLNQDYVTSFNTGNYDQAAAFFAPDDAFMAPHHDTGYGPTAHEQRTPPSTAPRAHKRRR